MLHNTEDLSELGGGKATVVAAGTLCKWRLTSARVERGEGDSVAGLDF